MKSVMFYMTHLWNDDIASRFELVYNQVSPLVDVVLFYKFKLRIPEKWKSIAIPYDDAIMWNNLCGCYLDPFLIYRHLFRNNPYFLDKYEYLYMYEYDQVYMGDLTAFIKQCEEIDADLIASSIVTAQNSWFFKQKYLENCKENNLPIYFERILKSCLSFCRVSCKYLRDLCTEKFNDIIKSTIYELYIPSYIYKQNGTIKGLSIENNEFDWLDAMNRETFSCYNYFKYDDILKLNKKYNRPMWYTKWKTIC